MAKKQTKTNPCVSGYGGPETIYVSQAHYIAEVVCLNFANHKNKKLSIKFWEHRDWKQYFDRQKLLARGLLKIHDFKLILRVLNLPSRTYSLASPALDKLLEQENRTPQAVDIPKIVEKEARPTFKTKIYKFERLE